MRTRLPLIDTLSLLTFVLIYVGLTGCATLDSRLSQLKPGSSYDQVVEIAGKPDSIQGEAKAEYLLYGDAKVVEMKDGKLARITTQDKLRAEQQAYDNWFLTSTPLELCQKNDNWKRYGDMKECKASATQLQQERRAEIAEENKALEQRRAMALQMLLNRPPAAAYQPIPITVPNLNYTPTYVPPTRVNCTTSPGIAPGTTQTNCY